jgi:NAD(P)-dependent dehydrogenase (short-subunit alcohol dehydrogenase family)
MRTAIITGASGNLGQAVVKRFLDEGFTVIGTVIPNDPVPIEIAHKNFIREVVDLSDERSAEEFIQSTIQKCKTIDAAVLTVGGFAMGKLADTSIQNFETAYNTARPVFNQMMKQGYGRIFMIGSRPGLDMKSSKGMIAYGLSKSLIFRLAELMNDEAKGKNVVSSVIVPSTLDTPQNRKAMPESDPAKWVKAEEIAEIISFYCSEKGAILREPVIKVYGNS